MKLLLDTCAFLWAVASPDKLTDHTQKILLLPENEIFFSPISCPEIVCGVERRRTVLDRHWKKWLRYFVEYNGWQEIPIDLRITEEAYSLPEEFHSDPADRIIVATARIYSMTVVTGDRKILDYPHVESIA